MNRQQLRKLWAEAGRPLSFQAWKELYLAEQVEVAE